MWGVVFLLVALVSAIPLPSSLLLLLKLLILVLGVLALEALAELPALHALLETEAVLLLTVGFLAGAEDHSLHAWLIGVDLFEIMHVFAVFLPQQLGQLMLLLLQLQLRVVFLQLEPSGLLQELVLGSEAAVAALPDHTNFPWSEVATAVLTDTLLLCAIALMRDLKL